MEKYFYIHESNLVSGKTLFFILHVNFVKLLNLERVMLTHTI